jgi:hypothetical protein
MAKVAEWAENCATAELPSHPITGSPIESAATVYNRAGIRLEKLQGDTSDGYYHDPKRRNYSQIAG